MRILWLLRVTTLVSLLIKKGLGASTDFLYSFLNIILNYTPKKLDYYILQKIFIVEDIGLFWEKMPNISISLSRK